MPRLSVILSDDMERQIGKAAALRGFRTRSRYVRAVLQNALARDIVGGAETTLEREGGRMLGDIRDGLAALREEVAQLRKEVREKTRDR